MRKFLPALLASAVIMTATVALAQNTSDASTTSGAQSQITFPIPELGNCGSKDACRIYCAQSANAAACIAYGEAHGLMDHGVAQKARDFIKMTGPGGCVGIACKAYCSDP